MLVAEGSTPAPRLRDVWAGFPRPPAGPWPPSALFPDRSVTRRIAAERVVMLGGGRALLMQIAHPLVAAGVADHRDPARLPWDRLWGTLAAVLAVVFGDDAQVVAVRERVDAIHRRVSGERDGAAYRALDPALLLWVHATLVDSAIVTWERFVGPMPAEVRSRYYREMKSFAAVFGLPPDEMPADLEAFDRYLSEVITSLCVTSEARRLSVGVLDPPAPLLLRPAIGVHRLVTVGLLPPSLRRDLGSPWSPSHERALALLASAVRAGLPLLPERIRRWPHAGSPTRSEPWVPP